MTTASLATLAFRPHSAVGSFFEFRVTDNPERPKQTYRPPEVFLLGYAGDLIFGRIDCESKLAAKRMRRLIDEFGGNLSFSPASECRKLQVGLPLVSRQFKKLYRVTMRSYAWQVRMKKAERLLKEFRNLNIDEISRVVGYSFTSAFSRCFQRKFGERPKRYQMRRGSSFVESNRKGKHHQPALLR